MNAGLVEHAIRRHADPRACILIPEVTIQYRTGEIGWQGRPQQADYRADFVMITAAGYLTEIEVKVSRSDWRADLAKPKWLGMPAWVSRFVYAVPEELGIPDWVPTHAGVWHVIKDQRHGLSVYTARAPKKIGGEKVPDVIVQKWMRNLYYRYWDQRRDAERRQLQRLEKTA